MPKHLIKSGQLKLGGKIALPRGDAYAEMHGGSIVLEKAEFSGGSGKSTAVRALRGQLQWRGGGASTPIGAYLLYAGDVTRGDDWLCELDVQGVSSCYGHQHETAVRLMGAFGKLRNLSLDVVAPGWRNIDKRPQVMQCRHARCMILESDLYGMIENGELAPRAAGLKQSPIYSSFAERFPTHLVYDRCILRGGACDAGKMFALYRNCEVVKRDIRGHESDTAFTQKSYKTDFGFHVPNTLLIGVKIHATGYRKIAAEGVIVGPDCWLNGSRITPEVKPGQARLLADKIEKGAAGY